MPDDSPSGSAVAQQNDASAHSHQTRPRRSKRFKIIVALVIVSIVLVAGYFLWRHFSAYQSTDDAQVDVHLYPVSSRIDGHVIKVNVTDNEWVQQGTVLVEMDPTDYQVAVDQAKANLASAEATARSLNVNVPITSVTTASQLQFASSGVENAQAAVTAAEKQFAAAHAELEQAEAMNANAQADLQRYKALVDKQEVSAQIYDQAVAAAKSSAASVAAARENEAAAQQAIQQAQSRVRQAEANQRSAEVGPQQVSLVRARTQAAIADVREKQAALQQAELNLQYTKIAAPITGQVNKTVVVGMNVEPGQQLLTLIPLDEVWITANFKETELKDMRVGQKAEIHADVNGRTYRGHVDSIAGATGPVFSLLPPQNATGNYVKIVQRVPVKIVLEPGENKDHSLRPGMNVEPDVYIR